MTSARSAHIARVHARENLRSGCSQEEVHGVDDERYQRYCTWRTEAVRRCRLASEPPAASRLPPVVDVRAIRQRLGEVLGGKPITQEAFARRFGFSVAAVRAWERRRCVPDAASRVLLLVIDASPHAVDAAIDAATDHGRAVRPAELHALD